MDFEFREELENVLARYGIPKEEVCLVGGVVLSLAGIRAHRDVDIVVSQDARSRITSDEKAVQISSHVEVCGKQWAGSVGLTDDDLIRDTRYHKLMGGFKTVRLEILFSVELRRRREKGINDIRLIEEYIINGGDWDWSLVRVDIKSDVQTPEEPIRPPSMVGPATRLLSLGKRALANPRAAIRFVLLRIMQLVQSLGKRAVTYPRAAIRSALLRIVQLVQRDTGRTESETGPTPHVKSQLVTKMPTAALLGNQFIDGEFSRYDVIMRYLAVQSIMGGSEEFKRHYILMQDERVGYETYESLCELVRSIQQKGFLSRYSIPITEEGLILDGAHRLACALYFGIDKVPVTIQPSRQRIYYGRKWFAEHGFDDELLTLLDTTKDMLFQKHGVWFPLILWPPVEPWFDEITKEVGEQFLIKWEETFDLANRFSDFARQIYAIDDIERWKVELKIYTIQKYKPLVRVLALEIPDPNFRPKQKTQSYLSCVGEDIKKWIRDSYKCKVPGYIYDIICHTGDNQEHNRRILEIVNSVTIP